MFISYIFKINTFITIFYQNQFMSFCKVLLLSSYILDIERSKVKVKVKVTQMLKWFFGGNYATYTVFRKTPLLFSCITLRKSEQFE